MAASLGLFLILLIQAQPTVAIEGFSDISSFNAGSLEASINETIDFYTVLNVMEQKSYFVGIRFEATDANVCYGVLISPYHVLTSGCKQPGASFVNMFTNPKKKKYAVIGSRYNSGSYKDDGSETIRIDNYFEHKKYSNSGYRALSIYHLKRPSTFTPVKLPDTETVSLSQNTSLMTFGWANVNNQSVMTKRVLLSASGDVCEKQKISFKDCICTVTSSAEDGCDIVNGSPLIMKQGNNDILIGLRYTYKEACGISGFPVAFTSLAGALAWAKKKEHASDWDWQR